MADRGTLQRCHQFGLCLLAEQQSGRLRPESHRRQSTGHVRSRLESGQRRPGHGSRLARRPEETLFRLPTLVGTLRLLRFAVTPDHHFYRVCFFKQPNFIGSNLIAVLHFLSGKSKRTFGFSVVFYKWKKTILNQLGTCLAFPRRAPSRKRFSNDRPTKRRWVRALSTTKRTWSVTSARRTSAIYSNSKSRPTATHTTSKAANEIIKPTRTHSILKKK